MSTLFHILLDNQLSIYSFVYHSIVHMTSQDRRITKTRKAIYTAFLQLLNQEDYESITVQEIIDLADVGRSTFYSHYESKELLLDELCQYLFHHLFNVRKI